MRKLLTVLFLAAGFVSTNTQASIITFEPDDYAAGTDVSHANPYVSLQTFRNYQDTSFIPTFAPVFISQCAAPGPNCYSTTGARSFGDGYGGFESWGAFGGSLGAANGCFTNLRLTASSGSCTDRFNAMLLTFASTTDYVEVSGAFWAQDETYLYGFDDNFNLVGAMNSTIDRARCQGAAAFSDYCHVTTSLTSTTGGIRYVLAGGWSNGTSLDNLRFNCDVPEPGTLALMTLGLVGIWFARRRKTVPLRNSGRRVFQKN